MLLLPIGGGGYFRLLQFSFTAFSVRRLNGRERKPMMFYLHPRGIEADQPRGKVSFLTRIRHYSNIAGCETKLRRLVNDWPFAPANQSLRGGAAAGQSIDYQALLS